MRQPKHQNQIETSRSLRLAPLHSADGFTVDRPRVVIPFPEQAPSSSRKKWYQAIERTPIFLLRLSLATVFLWFGLLKLASVSPVVPLLKSSLPILAATPFLQLLGAVEVGIAVGLVSSRSSRHTVFLMILHLLATLSVAVLSPQLIFAPRFPILTMAGEFLVKNLVLIAGGIVIMFSREARTPRLMPFTD
jgi:putative oxidoreductase